MKQRPLERSPLVAATLLLAGVPAASQLGFQNEDRSRIGEGSEPELKGVFAGPAKSFFGHELVGADTDGDGQREVVIGAPSYSDVSANQGRVYLYEGIPEPGVSATWVSDGGPSPAYHGFSLDVADVNADGFDDVLIGAPLRSNGEGEEGAAFAYLGSAQGLPGVPSWSFEPNIADRHVGSRVACAGDVDGDGFDDVLVAGDFRSETRLFLGSAQGLESTPAWSTSPGGRFASTAGDVNGDGFDDFLVQRTSFEGKPRTEVILFLGSGSGPVDSGWSVELRDPASMVVAGGGDLDGDGYDDVVVGAARFPNPQVYRGRASGLSASPRESLPHVNRVALGDFNGDGYDDLLIGQRQAYLFLGSRTGVRALLDSQCPLVLYDGFQCADYELPDRLEGTTYEITAVRFVGDLDGDGREDFLLGSPAYGASVHFYGHGSFLQTR